MVKKVELKIGGTGTWTKDKEHINNTMIPLYYKENIEKNFSLVDALKEIAAEKDIAVAQLAFAWLLSKGEDIISLIGSTRVASLQNSVKSLDINLSESNVKRIENAIPENEIAGNSRDMIFRNGKVVQVL